MRVLPKREKTVARDLCDCIYHHDEGVKCEVLSVGRVLVYTYIEAFERCLSLRYFSKLVKDFQYFDEVQSEHPQCSGCVIVEVGGKFFVRWVK